MNSLLILLGLFTVGYGLQCPKCLAYDFSDVSGVSEEIKAVIESPTEGKFNQVTSSLVTNSIVTSKLVRTVQGFKYVRYSYF